MKKRSIIAGVFLLCGNPAWADEPPALENTRPALLYSTHCNACHNEQIHWRAKQLSTDWENLRFQVRRWQDISGLGWGDQDIEDVAHYLNDLYYHYPTKY
jgi:mono/diheme cytochrome c family protein